MMKTIQKSVVESDGEVITFKLVKFVSKEGITQYRAYHNNVLLKASETMNEPVQAYKEAVEKATQ